MPFGDNDAAMFTATYAIVSTITNSPSLGQLYAENVFVVDQVPK
jgi:hypothetical protein